MVNSIKRASIVVEWMIGSIVRRRVLVPRNSYLPEWHDKVRVSKMKEGRLFLGRRYD
jgi:hypothetical protein